jgi:periplasmic protein CpxP/Spy
MSLYSKLKGVCLGLVLILACAGLGQAQQGEQAQQDNAPGIKEREGRHGGHGRENKMMGMMRALREVNLTDAQRQQTRAIFERFVENTRPQREALEQLRQQYEQGATAEETSERAKQLRGEIRTAMQSARTEVLALLTPEQRTKFEQVEQEMKARHEEKRNRFRSQ